MGNIVLAFRAFFAVLFYGDLAIRIKKVLDQEELSGPAVSAPLPIPQAPTPVIPAKPKQSEAVTLLATLQREARLVDFLKEDLAAYSDDQVGAAVREVHRESGAVLERLFEIRPILVEAEGANVDVPAGFDAARYRITGKLTADAPYRGILRHHGWEITKCELPEFVGSPSAAKTVSPAEVEIR